MTKNADALVFVEEAIEALSIEMSFGTAGGENLAVSGPQYSLALVLDSIGRRVDDLYSDDVMYDLAERIRQCTIALYAARTALSG